MTSVPADAMPKRCPGCSRGLGRREFLSAATLAAVAAALDACTSLTGPGGGWNGSYGGPFTVTLANFSALSAVGGVARVDNGSGAPTALYRSSSTTFVALAMVCTHTGYYPIDIVSSGFYCPVHGSSFSKTGGVTGGPAPSGLASFATSYNATAGTVTVNRPA
ncbi:MAG: ubiquinol-cytochrome c reductase iron-sulfur subunit [Gemmatimonadales bacterium]